MRTARPRALSGSAVPSWLALPVVLLSLLGHATAASRDAYVKDLAAFFEEADRSYAFFDLKSIREDWARTKDELSGKVKACRSDGEFLRIVSDAIRCLRDAHMGLHSEKAKLPPAPPEYYPGISLMPATENRVVVMSPPEGREKAIPVGTVVVEIDGKDARTVLEERATKAWAEGGWFSSPQRARVLEYRIPLRGKRGEKHPFTFLLGGSKRTTALVSTVEARGWPHVYNMPANLTRVGRSFLFTKLPSGAGYMYLRNVDQTAEAGITQALAKHADAKGWVIDLCGNGGGGYSEGLIEKLKSIPKPVAVLIDAGCFSAGETLARDIVQFTGARVFGSKTAGSSSAKREWQFPSGIATVTFSTRSRWRSDRKPIEFNGIDPDEEVEAVPEEVARGLNSAIRRAEEFLAKR